MWKGRKFILAAVLVTVMVIGGTAGLALAQGEDESQGPRGVLMARVAEILDIDEQELEDAFKQAQSELREEALDTRLQQLVDEGKLTQQRAEELKAWMEARPDVPMVGPRLLMKLLDEGVLTQAQVDEYKAWMEARPDVPILHVPRRGMPRARVGPEQLQKLVDEGILTQDELEQLEALRAKIGEGIRERLGQESTPPIK